VSVLLITLAILAGTAIVGWVIGRLIDLGWEWRWSKQRRPGGFEVKLNTGEEPVIKTEREIDHG
jgi:hypothetical protein